MYPVPHILKAHEGPRGTAASPQNCFAPKKLANTILAPGIILQIFDTPLDSWWSCFSDSCITDMELSSTGSHVVDNTANI